MSCPFCAEIREDSVHIFYKGKGVVARIDGTPRRFGHFEIIPRTCVACTGDLSAAVYQELWTAGREAKAVMQLLIRSGELVRVYKELLATEARPGFRACLEAALQAAPRLQAKPIRSWGYVMADGPEAGQTVSHAHLHFYPCWDTEQNPRGWPRLGFSDPDPYLIS